ncbi:tetratricopeptide repeat protein [Actinoallomurus iriomotensis]|nr:tetratricopeptide repeat protein [Actinoallomurus iriomotensis]
MKDQAGKLQARASVGELAADEGPAGLLDPRRAVVDFVGREGELAELIAWCGDDSAGPVRLVTGPGGVGKSRLAVQLCARMAEVGWSCVRVGDGGETGAVSAFGGGRPLLLMVDYAETRVGLAGLLRQVAAAAEVPVRVLLLARSAGEWWDRLGEGEPRVRKLLADAYPGESLASAVAEGLSDEQIVALAVPQFARALGVRPPERVRVATGAGRARILDLHAAALVAVLNARDGDGTAEVLVDVAEVLDELLGHEERFWQGSAVRGGLLEGPAGMTVATLRQIVAAGALLGAASRDEAMDLLERVPGAVVSLKVAGWLRELYPPHADPGAGAEWLGSLQPDRLAEHHVVAQLSTSTELAEACLEGLDDRQARRALTLLGRASVDQPAAAPLLERVLPLLERVVADLTSDLDTLTAIADAIPYPTILLAEANVAITRRILGLLPAEAVPLHGRWLTRLGVALSQVGRPAEALPVTEEAVAIRRELAAAYPDRYRPDLARSLSNLGVGFSELGRPAEALTVAEEAVTIYRELAAAYPDRYRPDLARFLSNLGVRFSELGRPAEARPVSEEAVAILRELAAAYPDRYRPDLADALSNVGVRFSELGRPAEALTVAEETVTIYRELAAAYPDRYRPDLADALSNVGIWFSELGRPIEALTVAEEAVTIYRELAAAYPDRYRPDLADALNNLGIWFSELGRPAEALPVAEEAVAIRRELAAIYPDRYRPKLAQSLNNLGISFSKLGRSAEALPVAEEAVAIRRELAAIYPDRYRPDLAQSLNNLGISFSELGRSAEALPVAEEALAIRRELAAIYPDRYRPDLTRSFEVLIQVLEELGRPGDAEHVRGELDRLKPTGDIPES